MRRWKFAVGLVSMGAVVLMLAPSAGAQTGSITFDPSTVTAGGGKLFVNGKCEPNTSGFVISHTFAKQPGGTDFAGVPALAITTASDGTFGIGLTIDPSVPAGAYSVTLRCGGGLAASGTLTVTSLAATGAPLDELVTLGATVIAVGLAAVVLARRRAGTATSSSTPPQTAGA
jgi:hypothetical protein